MKINLLLFTLILLALNAYSDSPVVKSSDLDARSSSMAGTFTAISDNYTAAFWNPAGLAFLPIRGIDISMGYLQNSQESIFDGEKTESSAGRVKLNSVGWIRSIPVTRGGLTFALGVFTPYNFDNNYSFRGLDTYIGEQPITGAYYTNIIQKDSVTFDTIADTLHTGESLWFEKAKNRSYGGLTFIGASAAFQIAKGLSIGATLSYITGRENQQIIFETYRGDDNSLFEDSKEFIERSYSGLDFRVSMLFKADKIFSAGLLIDLPQYVKFSQIYQYTDQYYGINFLPVYDDGRLKTPTLFSAGIAFNLPFAIVSIQGNSSSPIPSAEEESDRSFWQNSFSGGISLPLGKLPLHLNGGYSFGDEQIYPYIMEWSGGYTSNEPKTAESNKIKTLSGGIEWLIKDIMNISLSYSGTKRDYTLKNSNWRNMTTEKHIYNRVTASLNFRY